jgi:hypothetical protein
MDIPFIRTPLTRMQDLKGHKIIGVHDVGDSKFLLVSDRVFVFFEAASVEDEFGRCSFHRVEVMSQSSAICSHISPDKALEYGLIDAIGCASWKQMLASEEEDRLQKLLDRDLFRYQQLQKVFERVWEKVDGKWQHRTQQ